VGVAIFLVLLRVVAVCVVVIGFPLGALIGAAVLRLAVGAANKCLPPNERELVWDDADDLDAPDCSGAIPRLGTGKAFGIVAFSVFLGLLSGLFVTVPLWFIGEKSPAIRLLAVLLQIPLGFLLVAGARTAMLPTSFARACLVVLFECLIVFAIVLAIAVPLALFFAFGQ
jgi:hypothetical protein